MDAQEGSHPSLPALPPEPFDAFRAAIDAPGGPVPGPSRTADASKGLLVGRKAD